MRWIPTLGMSLMATTCLSVRAWANVDQIEPVAGMRITASARIVPGTYRLADSQDDGALLISGDDITVDFAGAAIIEAREGSDPDRFTGRGIVVRGKNVTLKNAKVHGYKIGIYAENSPGIRITGCDISRNYRQRLKSTITHEELSDWLYGHENDNNEWLRYGAGIYLLNCPGATVANCRARNGQNGLCICRCDGVYVVDNDMSFMSGWGLAMWQSSRCDVFNNKFDWCIRAYSHGVYSRGQDSAGILVYEQCSDNVFAYCSVTHGGDGFFLYAGNETLKKTGKGGCNNNLVYRNDFSHAAANGIEATFSDGNRFIENILDECNHGVWAGYSSNSLIHRNTIRGSVNGISIEHGRNNRVLDNTIEEASRGIHLWWDDDKNLLESAFGKANDRCLSTGNLLMGNSFTRVKTALQLVDDTHSRLGDNTFRDVATALHVGGHVDGLRVALPPLGRAKVLNEASVTISFVEQLPATRLRWVPLSSEDATRLHAKKGKRESFLPEGAMRGRKYIFVDEWGPYDFSDVRLFPSRIVGGAKAALQLLGPPGSSFRVVRFSGDVTVAPIFGTLPARLTVTANGDGVHDFTIDLKTSGGGLHATGTLLRSDWRVAFYRWSREDDPRGPEENWKRIINAKPLEVINTLDVDFVWKYAAPTASLPPDHFATVAGTTLTLPKGRWRISTVSDDGVRVFINGTKVLSNWAWHGPTLDEAMINLDVGPHEIRVEHFEIDGHAQLQFHIEPAPAAVRQAPVRPHQDTASNDGQAGSSRRGSSSDTWNRPRTEEAAVERREMVRRQIEARGINDPGVLAAMRNVPRHWFVSSLSRNLVHSDRPLPIGGGQTISQPYIVALMTESLHLTAESKVLEIGTGSGYQAAVLSEITPHVFTIEIVEPLARRAIATFKKHGYDSIKTRIGDGYAGWVEHAPYDGIIVTCAPDHIPPKLIEQLRTGGRICIPVGGKGAVQELVVVTKKENGRLEKKSLIPVRFVPMTGEARTRKTGDSGG